MGDQKIEWVTSFKYLGVTLQSNLCWDEHIKNISKRATFTWAQCKKMVGSKWGLSPKICKYSFITLVRPILAYGSFAWINALSNKKQVSKLNKVQRLALLEIANGMHSTPTAGMEIIAGILPIKIHLETVAINTCLRMKRNHTWRVQPGEVFKEENHSVILENLIKEIKDVRLPQDKLRHKEMTEKRYKIAIDSREDWIDRVVRPTPLDEKMVNIFTDGSKIAETSGCGYITRGKHFSEKGFRNLGDKTTVFQAEITAIIDATENILGKDITGKDINYYIDSQAALKALSNYVVRHKTVSNCKNLLNKLSINNSVKLQWIPAHRGHLGNEIADRMARLGTGTNRYGPALLVPVPVSSSFTKKIIKRWANNKHQEFWDTIRDHRQSKMTMPQVGMKVWNAVKKLTRKSMRISTHMLTGHNVLRYHLNNMDKENSPMCEQCNEGFKEDAFHFIGRCAKWADIRYSIFRFHFLNKDQMSNINVQKVLTFTRKTQRYLEE